jgi:hypothetical protein
VEANSRFAGRLGDDLIGRFRAIGLAIWTSNGEGHPPFQRFNFEGVLGAARALDFYRHIKDSTT